MRKAIENWMPPALVEAARRIRGARGGFSVRGDYASWNDATRDSSGYGSEEILQRVRRAALQVQRGEARFERDGICFHHEEYRWEVLACLMLGAAACGGRLNVLDFGGALGGFYRQHEEFLGGLPGRWGIVEQRHYVECGRKEFQGGALEFHSTIEECAEEMPVDLALLSSVLQYVEDPVHVLTKLEEVGVRFIVIDRTTFREAPDDLITVQVVPDSIFPATMPMRVFSETRFESLMDRLGYSRITRFSCPENDLGEIRFSGSMYRRSEENAQREEGR
jgi:putative methyltransferase (TIGR04325 family)